MSRIVLDEQDRGSVQRARDALARSEATDTGVASTADLLVLLGSLQGAVDILLRILDGGEA